ncbi:MAG TPA: TetR/AcrR family transcriptional regulator [Burkholderiaceae bacterium]|nr:TetR/AcrR family transcriptional regulator [Burkholderiaceae bacterium]
MARPKASDYDAQRDGILDAATAAFAELGYASASMSQLAQACGTSKARLYHYFPSKEAILFESLDRYTRRLVAIVESVRERGLAPRDELAELVRSLLVEYRDSRARHVSLLNDVRFLAPAQRDRIEAQQRRVVDAVAATLGRVAPGRFAPGERKPATMALFGMINFTFAWLRPDGPMSYERYAELVIDLWERGLCEPAGEARAV